MRNIPTLREGLPPKHGAIAMRNRPRHLFKWLVLGATILVSSKALLLAGSILLTHIAHNQLLTSLRLNEQAVRSGVASPFKRYAPIDLICEGPNRYIPYQLIGGLYVKGPNNETIQINGQGYRTNTLIEDRASFEQALASGELAFLPSFPGVTIAGIGDSILFGQGVANGNNYAALLERGLNSDGALLKSVRFINSGVPGYNTRVAAEVLKSKLLRLKPDIVLYGFCGNDADLPHFANVPEGFVDTISTFIRPGSRLAKCNSPDKALTQQQLPPWYTEMAGWDSVREGLELIAHICVQRGLPLEIVLDVTYIPSGADPSRPETYLGDANRRVLEFVSTRHHGIIDPFPRIIRYMREQGFTESHELWVNLDKGDQHPSVRKHELIAAAIIETLKTRKYFQPFLGN